MAAPKKRIAKLFTPPSRDDYIAAANVIEFWREVVTSYDLLKKRRHPRAGSVAATARVRFDGLVAALAHYASVEQRGITLIKTWQDPSSHPEKGALLIDSLVRLISLYREAERYGGGIADVVDETGAPGLIEFVAKLVGKSPRYVRSALIKAERTPDGAVASPKPSPAEAALQLLTALGVASRSTVKRRKRR